MRVLSEPAVAEAVSLADLLPVVERAFVRQGRGEVERPDRPHFPVGVGVETGDDTTTRGTDDPLGTGLAMPAYLHGDRTYATKLVGVHPDNPSRGLPTVHAQLVVSEAATGRPVLLAAAERLTNLRTGAIGGLAARDLAPGAGPVRLGVLGAGTQARWQTRAVAETRGVADARIYSPTPSSREACAAELREEGIDAAAVESPRAAVTERDAVVTATTASQPVFPGEALAPGTLVVAVGAYTADTQELDRATFDRASRVFADVPEEVAEIGDVIGNDVDPDRLRPLSTVFDGNPAPGDGITVVESVGTAVLDAAAGELLAGRVEDGTLGTDVEL
ncbi:MAG: ornithine cyclodeaminase family protein [Halobaculum sp.]